MSEQPSSSETLPSLNHDDPNFSPLDSSQLNDYRRRIVAGEQVSDDELKHSIQTFLYHERERLMKETRKTPKKKATRTRAAPLADDFSFDDLLDTKL